MGECEEFECVGPLFDAAPVCTRWLYEVKKDTHKKTSTSCSGYQQRVLRAPAPRRRCGGVVHGA